MRRRLTLSSPSSSPSPSSRPHNPRSLPVPPFPVPDPRSRRAASCSATAATTKGSEGEEEQEEEEDYAYENDGFEDVDEDTGIDATGKAKPGLSPLTLFISLLLFTSLCSYYFSLNCLVFTTTTQTATHAH